MSDYIDCRLKAEQNGEMAANSRMEIMVAANNNETKII